MDHVTAKGYFNLGYGFAVTNTKGSTVDIKNSTLGGDFYNDSSSYANIANSQLAVPSFHGGNITCVNSYDTNFKPVGALCK